MRRPRGPTQSEEIHENGNQEDPTEISQEVQQDRSIVGARSSSEAVMARPGPLRASCGYTKSAGLPGMAIPQFHFMTEISSIKICIWARRQFSSIPSTQTHIFARCLAFPAIPSMTLLERFGDTSVESRDSLGSYFSLPDL
jgi:hypothetical protein